jgi:LacI family transcriptional regulator
MKVSLKDIINQLQLSKTTVSWALSGKGLSMAMREKVFVYARENGFVACFSIFFIILH